MTTAAYATWTPRTGSWRITAYTDGRRILYINQDPDDATDPRVQNATNPGLRAARTHLEANGLRTSGPWTVGPASANWFEWRIALHDPQPWPVDPEDTGRADPARRRT